MRIFSTYRFVRITAFAADAAFFLRGLSIIFSFLVCNIYRRPCGLFTVDETGDASGLPSSAKKTDTSAAFVSPTFPVAADHADRLILKHHAGEAGLREKPDRRSTDEHEDTIWRRTRCPFMPVAPLPAPVPLTAPFRALP